MDFAKLIRLPLARILFKEMKDYGIPPSIVTYASLLDGLCRSVRLDEAVSLLEDMEDHILMDS